MRILHATQPTTAGVARCVAALTAAQVAHGDDVHVLAPPGGDLTQWRHPDVTVHDWAIGRSPGFGQVRAGHVLRRLATRLDVDVVHLHSSAAGLAGRSALRGSRPTIFQPHAWSFLAATGPERVAAVAWERLAARWADVLVCVSEGERQDGRDVGINAAMVVVPNGVDVDAWPAADADDRVAARHRLGLSADGHHVVCVGRLSRQKGQDLLVAAWESVAAQFPTARLHLVGPTQDLQLAPQTGVHLHGARDDVWDWYAAADLVVLPSRWEGMSLTLLETMATQRAIVTSDATGNREALRHAPTAVVPVGDLGALAEALVARLRDPGLADAEARRHREAAVAHHDLRDTIERLRVLTCDLA